MSRNNPFELNPPIHSTTSHKQEDDLSQPPLKPLKPMIAETLSAAQNPFLQPAYTGKPSISPTQVYTHLDINDTQTLDGLAVHLQSPRLRRQYWVQHYQRDYITLGKVVMAKEALAHFLTVHRCLGLLNTLEQDATRHTQLGQLYATLYHNEDAHLSSIEKQGQAIWVRLDTMLKRVRHSLKELVFPSMGYNAPDGYEGTPNPAILSNSHVATFREWLNYLSAKQSKQGLPPQLLQELYHIRHQLF
jgi:hypothetical protein